MAEKLSVALVFGSMAKGTQQAGSDVDVLVVGDVGFADVVRLLHPAQSALGRETNPKVYGADEWRARLRAGDPFARDVLAKPKIFLIGNDHDLAESAGQVTPNRETVARLLAAAERNLADYDGDPVPDSAVRDCIAGAQALFAHVKQWLTANRPDLL